MQKDKIETLIGFAVKANKLMYGADNISTVKKRFHLIVLDNSVSTNTRDKINDVASKRNIPILVTQKLLEDIVYKKNCKVIALTDNQMSKAVIKNINENYQLIVAEVK